MLSLVAPLMTGRKLRADDVAAFCWAHLHEHTRGALCALAHVPETLSLLEWYELSHDRRALLRFELADLVEHNASSQRVEYAPGMA